MDTISVQLIHPISQQVDEATIVDNVLSRKGRIIGAVVQFSDGHAATLTNNVLHANRREVKRRQQRRTPLPEDYDAAQANQDLFS